jgi:4-hydroxy-4-methyl-2-oxoglutarate aldolase
VGQHQVIRQIPRPEASAVEQLRAHGVATVHEAIGRRGLLAPEVRPIQRGTRIVGPAVTVHAQSGDNLMIHAAVEVIEPGDVLVVTTTSPSTDGMFGELLATSLDVAGCIGLIIDAGVRDVAELNEMGFPVWSRAVHAQGTVKATPGSVNVPVVCAGQLIEPGDVVVADDDGVVCVPRSQVAPAAQASAAREDREASVRERLAAGELSVDIYGLRDKLAELGVTYLDADPDRGS